MCAFKQAQSASGILDVRFGRYMPHSGYVWFGLVGMPQHIASCCIAGLGRGADLAAGHSGHAEHVPEHIWRAHEECWALQVPAGVALLLHRLRIAFCLLVVQDLLLQHDQRHKAGLCTRLMLLARVLWMSGKGLKEACPLLARLSSLAMCAETL